jgi:hypothetical protein
MDIAEILESVSFWILMGVGYGAFALMIIVLKTMGQSSIMPMWVKIVTIIAIPVVAALFSGIAEG